MTDRSIILSSTVIKLTTEIFTQPAIASGRKLVVTRIGMTDESKGAKPSIVRVKFGGVLIRTLCATTNTVDISIDRQFNCDGVKTLTVERENAENSDKPITVWVDAYERA